MQIKHTHKLSMHKFARRFERLKLEEIFWNFKQQYNT